MDFRRARKAAGLSARDVAKVMKVSHVAVFYWESGQTHPVASKLPKLARLYGCSVDELLEGQTERRRQHDS